MKAKPRLVMKTLPLLCCVACIDRTVSTVPVSSGSVESRDVDAVVQRDLDILFVIDDSSSMADEQTSLRANFSRFVDVLENVEGGLPDLHIGVITPNLGTSATDGTMAAPAPGCSGQGEGGLLRALGAGGPRFLETFADPAGGPRLTNFPGRELTDAFSQLANVGANGCGIEQHLEAMKRATDGSHPENAGFRRPGAALAIVIIADEDDCSLAHSVLFDANDRSAAGYGVKTNLRCVAQSVACTSPATPFDARAGERTGCTIRTEPTETTPIERYVEHLRALQPREDKLLVTGIVSDPAPFVITSGPPDDLLQLKQNCPASTPGLAFPAVRTAALIDRFELHTRSSICDGDLADGLVEVAKLISRGVGSRCFEREPSDVDPETPGAQYECSITEVRRREEVDEEVRTYPQCDAATANTPCWRIQQNLEGCGTDHGTEIVIERGTEIPSVDQFYKIQCITTK